jgi:uncharacterized MAPEG superfamily protein
VVGRGSPGQFQLDGQNEAIDAHLKYEHDAGKIGSPSRSGATGMTEEAVLIGWILAVLALFVVQTLIGPAIQYLGGTGPLAGRLALALGPRDNTPPASVVVQRAGRALANMQEAMPVFLTVAILLVALGKVDVSALRGATIFFFARLVYVPSYMIGIAGLRSLVWVIGWIGLGMMIASLVAAIA